MIRFFTLGALDLRAAEGHELRGVLAQPKRTALLAYLTLATPRGFHRRDTLLGVFWPDFEQERARKALRQAVHFLRHELGDGVVVSRGDEDLAVDPERLWCDAVTFEQTLQANPAEALEHYRGDLLPGFFVSDAPEFERWLEAERLRFRTRAAAASSALATQQAARGDEAGAVHWARRAAGLAPDDEGAMRRLLEHLLRTGDRAGAVRAYQEFAERLKRDYEVEPAAETRAVLTASQVSPELHPDSPQLMTPTANAVRETRSPIGPSEPVPGPRPARQVWRYLLASLAAAVTLLVAGAVVWRPSRRAAPPVPDAVAVLPFTIRGSGQLENLRDGAVDLLSAKLEGAPGLRSIDPRAVLAASRGDTAVAADPERGRQVAERFGAAYYVAGDIVEIAGRLQLSAALYARRARWQPVARVNVEGDSPDLPTLVDQLVAQLLTALGSGRDTALVHIAGRTTRSLPALKAYLKGSRDFRAGREAEAVEAFREAVTLDTSFAMAYYGLAVAARWVSWAGEVVGPDAAARAARHADRLSPLARDLLSSYQTYLRLDGDSAEAAYRFIVAGHPDNLEAQFMLGETLFHLNGRRGRPFTEAWEPFERVLAFDSTDAHAMVHLARIAASDGKLTALNSLTRRLLALHPNAERALEMRTLRAFALDDTAEQRQVSSDLRRASDIELDAAMLAITSYDQDLAAAGALAPAYAVPGRNPYWLARGHLLLAQVPLAGGKWRRAMPEPATIATTDPNWLIEARALFATIPAIRIPRAWLLALRDSIEGLTSHSHGSVGELGFLSEFRYHADLEAQVRAYLLGLVSARVGDTAAARRYVGELEQLSAAGDSGIGADLAHGVRAEMAWSHGGAKPALAELLQFRLDSRSPTLQHIFWAGAPERFLQAELLRGLGRDEEALQLYRSFATEAYFVYLAPSHLRQAEIYQRLGKLDEAIAHYSRFVQLWRDAEPELQPLVAQARQARERLQSRKDP